MDIIRSMLLPVVAGVCIGVLVARFSNEDVLKAVWAGAATAFSLKLFFAGDYLVGPHAEAAVTSGLQAASAAIESLNEPKPLS